MKEKTQKPPSILTDVGLNMFVDTRKLGTLPMPVVAVSIDDLLWHFDVPVWEKEGTDDWNLTPWEVIKKEKGSAEHQKRVEESDTAYPIIITIYKERYVVLDGVHRLVKTYLQGEKTIKAKIIPKKYLSLRKFKT